MDFVWLCIFCLLLAIDQDLFWIFDLPFMQFLMSEEKRIDNMQSYISNFPLLTSFHLL